MYGSGTLACHVFDPTPLLLEAWGFHPRPSVNPLYSKCKILKFADNIILSNFLFAHDSIKSNLPTSFCDSITTHPHTSEIKKQIR